MSDFDQMVEEADPFGPLNEAVRRVNEEFFVVQIGGSVMIGSFVKCEALGREQMYFMKPADFRLKYLNEPYLVGFTKSNKEIFKDLGAAWLEHRDRRQYPKGAGFYVRNDPPPGVLNLWRGWGYEPKAGSWEKIAWHLLHVVCDGNADEYEYLVSLLAYWVQNPEKVGEVSIVMRGRKGTGKGTVADILKRWFLNHFVHISQSKHLTGNFNAHLADCLLLFADEVVWGGDKQAEGTLKALITERVVQIEPKGVNAFSMANRLKIVQASNAEWCVPVTAEERRYFVQDVSERVMGDRSYFNELHKAIEGGEAEAMLCDLLEMDLAGFSHRDVPHTTGLNRQKVEGLDSVGHWWMSCLEEGRVVGNPILSDSSLEARAWPTEVYKGRIHAAYLQHCRDHNERHPKTENVFPRVWREKYAPLVGSGRKRGMPFHWEFQALRHHRREFERLMNIDGWGWPEIDEEEERIFEENVHNFRPRF